jgi:hypothetical protein
MWTITTKKSMKRELLFSPVFVHAVQRGDLGCLPGFMTKSWIPTFAGMTGKYTHLFRREFHHIFLRSAPYLP